MKKKLFHNLDLQYNPPTGESEEESNTKSDISVRSVPEKK
jgi:hypothetical protein